MIKCEFVRKCLTKKQSLTSESLQNTSTSDIGSAYSFTTQGSSEGYFDSGYSGLGCSW